jgi:hypothetical protein
MTRLNPQLIPTAARPPAVEQAVSEAAELRARLDDARRAATLAAAELERAEANDVEAAALATRQGAATPKPDPALAKAKAAADTCARQIQILGRALEMSHEAAAAAITTSTPGWLEQLTGEQDRARDEALELLDRFEAAVGKLRAAAAAQLWLQQAGSDQRYDRAPVVPTLGSAAPSSARRTANSEPIDAATVVGYCRELVDPPPPQQRVPLGMPSLPA